MCKSICNIIVTTVFVFVWIILLVGSAILKPNFRGFDCRNIEIRYPLKRPTVGVLSLIFLAILLPILVIIAVDLSNFLRTHKPPGFKKKTFILGLLVTIAKFLMAQIILHTIGNMIKATAGEMRPCFMAACKPNVNCSDPAINGRYVYDYKCTNTGLWAIQSRLTFPSGHSYGTAMSMVYVGFYVETRLKVKRFILGKISLQYLFSVITIFVAVSRVVDFHHRWVDVTVGIIFGAVAGVAHSYVTNLFEPHNEEIDEVSQDLE